MLQAEPDPEMQKNKASYEGLNKYEGINRYWADHKEYPFFEKIYRRNESDLIKEVNFMMQKGWIPLGEPHVLDQGTEVMGDQMYYMYLMRSPMVSLPATPLADFKQPNEGPNEGSNSTDK